jgi:Co/Zn/Cd efflux system component
MEPVLGVRAYPRLSASDLTTLTHFTVASEAVAGLIAAVLFVWIARACLQGKNPARITAAVLCGLAIVGAFLALTVPDLRADRSSADLIVSFVVAGIGLVSTCILWQRSSSAYFRQVTRPRA